MKLITIITLLLTNIASAQSYTYATESFESSTWLTPSTSYPVTTGTYTTSATSVSGSPTSPHTGSNCLSIPTSQYINTPTLPTGAGILTFYARSTSTSARTITISTSTDGSTYTTFTTASSSASSLTYSLITVNINNSITKNIRIAFSGSGAIDDLNITNAPQPIYYNAPNSDLTNVASWFTGTDGATGGHPTNFTSAGQTFNITHTGSTMSTAWTVSGTASKIVLGDGTNAVSFTIPAASALTGIIDVNNNATLNNSNTSNPTLETLAAGSTVAYMGSGAQTIQQESYSNLTISGSRNSSIITLPAGLISVGSTYNNTVTNAAYILSGNVFDFASSSSQTIPAGFYNSITNSGNGSRTLASSGTISLAGTLSPGTGNFTNIGSTVQFTAALASFTLNLPNVLSGSCYNTLIINGNGSSFIIPTISGSVNLANSLLISTGTLRLNNSVTGNKISLGSVSLTGILELDTTILTINGTVTGTGTITAGPASSLTINSAAGTLNFTAGSQVLKDLILNTNASATIGTSLSITAGLSPGSVTVSAGAMLNTSGNLTIKSDANGTARIAPSNGTINGNVTIERFIPANATRAWRLLSVPVITAQTFHNLWQENQPAGTTGTNNLGTHLTSSRTTWNADEFDYHSNNECLLSWDASLNGAGGWASVTSTNNPIATDNGYMLYVRGDRNATPSNAIITNTVLRTSGSLKQGNYPALPITVGGGQYQLIGNPYASQISFDNVTRGPGIDNTFYLWDPKLFGLYGLGGYQTITFDGSNYVLAPGGGSYAASGSVMKTIESGEAFFVHAATTSTISFSEAAKTSGSNMVFSPLTNGEKLVANLYTFNGGTATLADGNLTLYDDNFSNIVNEEDATKLGNIGLNFGILRDSNTLAIEKRKIIANSDTTVFSITGIPNGNYQFQFITSHLDHPNMHGFLKDNFTGTNTPINLDGTTWYTFSIDSAGSASSDRFKIIFTPLSTLPIGFTTINAYTHNRDIIIDWNLVYTEHFADELSHASIQLERSADGQRFFNLAAIAAHSSPNYSFTDNNPYPGYNYYRIRITTIDGETKFSPIAKAYNNSSRIIYNQFTSTIQFLHVPPGKYNIRLYDELGREVYNGTIIHAGGSISIPVPLPPNLNYYLLIFP